MEDNRRREHLKPLLIANLVLGLCVLVALVWGLDRLGDRLTAAISAEVHSEMWEQIRDSANDEAAERRLFAASVDMQMQTQDVLIQDAREDIIKLDGD